MSAWRMLFTGELALWQGLCLAAAGAYLAYLLYRRESRHLPRRYLRYLLPLLRCTVLAALLFALTGPVLRHRREEGRVGHVFFLLDGSQSMGLTDEHMAGGRKLLLCQARGDIPEGAAGTALYRASRLLGESNKELSGAAARQRGEALRGKEEEIKNKLVEAFRLLSKADLSDFPSLLPAPGTVTAEFFDGIAGSSVQNLTAGGALSRQPSSTAALSSLLAPRNRGDNYGTRIRGYLLPPLSGAYTFYLTSDDASVLLVSTDETPRAVRTVARVSNYVRYGGWEEASAGRSEPLTLTAGKRYFFQVLHKEGTGEDYVAVGWKRPDGRVERPIPARYCAPFGVQEAQQGDRPARIRARFKKEILQAFRSLVQEAPSLRADPAGRVRRLRAFRQALSRWQERCLEAFQKRSSRIASRGDPAWVRAFKEIAARTRWERAGDLLCDPRHGLLKQLRNTHELQVGVLSGASVRWVYSSVESETVPEYLPGAPGGPVTNLCDGLKEIVEGASERTACVVLSDGRHNDGGSPLQVGKLSGERGIALYTIGFGTTRKVPDIAVRALECPRTVCAEDRVTGEVVISDTMPGGLTFKVAISHGGRQLWEKELRTNSAGVRRIPFDASLREVAEQKRARAKHGVELLSVPVDLTAVVEPLRNEARGDNNESTQWVQVTTHGRKILFVDGRPRWEARYVRNLFDRDPRWRIDCLIADMYSDHKGWNSGTGRGRLPSDRTELFSYGLVILGDVPTDMFQERELHLLREFVETRGGGLIVLDGRDGNLRSFSQTPLADLLPIRYEGSSWRTGIDHLALSEEGKRCAAFALQGDPEQNSALWTLLPPPHWLSPGKALPGSETLLEAVTANGERVPCMVFRRFGAGKVLYVGTDELWRWRYKVADRYHTKFWNQVASWIMESPFSARDRYVSLDAGGPLHRAGDTARIRARVHDRSGRVLLGAHVEAILSHNGTREATVQLEGDPEGGGLYAGETPPLKPGSYEVRISVKELPELAMKASVSFEVKERACAEVEDLLCNEALLRDMAAPSGGKYLREEEAQQLVALLAPLSEGKVVVTETPLAHSYFWFLPVVLLLTVEWIVRKRNGML